MNNNKWGMRKAGTILNSAALEDCFKICEGLVSLNTVNVNADRIKEVLAQINLHSL